MKLFIGWLKHGSGCIPWFPCSLVDVATLLVLFITLVVSTCFNYMFSIVFSCKCSQILALAEYENSGGFKYVLFLYSFAWKNPILRLTYLLFLVLWLVPSPLWISSSLYIYYIYIYLSFAPQFAIPQSAKVVSIWCYLGNASVVTRWKAQVIQ